jgi:hypothetical protein
VIESPKGIRCRVFVLLLSELIYVSVRISSLLGAQPDRWRDVAPVQISLGADYTGRICHMCGVRLFSPEVHHQTLSQPAT